LSFIERVHLQPSKRCWLNNLLHRWRSEFRQGPGTAFPGHGQRRWSEGRIAELERKIGQQTLEIDFLKGCLQRIEEQRLRQNAFACSIWREVRH